MLLAIESLVRVFEGLLTRSSLDADASRPVAANDNDDAYEYTRRRAISR